MKLIRLLALLLIASCNPFQEAIKKKTFNPSEVKNILISNNGQSENFITSEQNIKHDSKGYFLSQERTHSWLSQLTRIESLNTENPVPIVNPVYEDAIEITLKDNSRYLFQGAKSKDSYLAVVQRFPPVKDSFSGIVHLNKEYYESLFPPVSSLRIHELPTENVDRIQYEISGKTFELSASDVEITKNILAEIKVMGHPYSGPVTAEIEDMYSFKQRMNGNIPGSVNLISETATMTLTFAKPKPHSALTYIYVKGRNEIYSAEIKKWQTLEMIFGKIVK